MVIFFISRLVIDFGFDKHQVIILTLLYLYTYFNILLYGNIIPIDSLRLDVYMYVKLKLDSCIYKYKIDYYILQSQYFFKTCFIIKNEFSFNSSLFLITIYLSNNKKNANLPSRFYFTETNIKQIQSSNCLICVFHFRIIF